METKFENAFLKAIKKHSGIKKQIKQKVLQIIEFPIELGEPLKGSLRGFFTLALLNVILLLFTCIV